MVAVKGFVRGDTVVAEDFLGNFHDGKDVIITILDTFHSKPAKVAPKKVYTEDDVKDAFGIWKDHEDSEDVEAYVRNLRRGRHFDI